MNNKTFKKLKLPDGPGIYFFEKGKEILYIGKATSLRDRVKSYFGKDLIETRGPLMLDMIFPDFRKNISSIDRNTTPKRSRTKVSIMFVLPRKDCRRW